MNDLTSIKGVKTFTLIQVPQHGSAVLATRGAERAIRGNTNSVEVSSVADEVIAELAVGQRPHLDKTIPATGNNEGNALARTESYAGHPLGMALGIGTYGVFAFAQSVPKLDGLVA